MNDLVLRNGTIVSPTGILTGDVAISGSVIAAVGGHHDGRRVIDASGKLVIPGAIDPHVHLEMPIGRFTSSDDFFHGTQAAAFGGTTAIVDFVETGANETMVEALAARRAKADPKVVIDYGLHMTIGPLDIARLDQLAAARAAGCYSFKLYMAYGLRLDDGQLLAALEAVGDVNGFPVVHAENWDIISALVARNIAAGRTAPCWHPRSRPAAFEAEAAGRVIDIAMYVDSPIYIFHVGCAATANSIAAAKARELPVYAETCPQYLYLTQEVYDRPGVAGALPVCSPPLRPEPDRQAMWAALREGVLDVVSTDHCPFTAEEKATGLHDFSRIPGGVPSIESRLALVYAGLVADAAPDEREEALMRWVDVCCTMPAELFGFANKGQIEAGLDADVVVFDPALAHAITLDSLHETAGWTPYEGLQVPGWPMVTISRGEVICENGAWLGQPGRGRFVVR